METKIIPAAEIVHKFSPRVREEKRIVFTNGCFDILHMGHLHVLSRAKALGDLLVVGLNSDASVGRLKGPSRPVKDQETRAALLAALEVVDFVILFHEDTPLELIRQVRPNLLVKGGDYREEEVVGGSFVKEHGGEVIIVPLLEGHSSTGLIEKSGKG